jgi:prophage regulatory protein
MSRRTQSGRCRCQECQSLDRRYPKEGVQLRLFPPATKAKAKPKIEVRKQAMPEAQYAPGRLMKMSEVERETSLHRATIYRRIAAGNFPPPIKLGERRIAWPKAAVESWKANQLAKGAH